MTFRPSGPVIIALAVCLILWILGAFAVRSAFGQEIQEPVRHYRSIAIKDTLGVTIRTEDHLLLDSRDMSGALIVVAGLDDSPRPERTSTAAGPLSGYVEDDGTLVVCINVTDSDMQAIPEGSRLCLAHDKESDTFTPANNRGAVILERCTEDCHGCDDGLATAPVRRGT